MKHVWARRISIFWTLFIGLGAVGGALAMLFDPTGESTNMAGLLPGLSKLPFGDTLFTDLVFSGVMLLIVNGLTQLFAFTMLMARAPRAKAWVIACGVVLMLWITIQFFIFELNPFSVSYFIFGLAEALIGCALAREAKRA